jgi:hypothetical protein
MAVDLTDDHPVRSTSWIARDSAFPVAANRAAWAEKCDGYRADQHGCYDDPRGDVIGTHEIGARQEWNSDCEHESGQCSRDHKLDYHAK